MQEYIIEIWHLISVSLNIKRAPPINTGLLRLLQLDENMCVFVCDCVFIQKAYACRLYSIRKCWTCKWIKRIIQECEAAVARARKKINGWREEKKKRTRSAHIHIYTKNMLVLMLTMRSLKSIDFYITHSHSRWLSLLKLPCSFSARLLHVGRSFARCRPRSSFPLSLSLLPFAHLVIVIIKGKQSQGKKVTRIDIPIYLTSLPPTTTIAAASNNFILCYLRSNNTHTVSEKGGRLNERKWIKKIKTWWTYLIYR